MDKPGYKNCITPLYLLIFALCHSYLTEAADEESEELLEECWILLQGCQKCHRLAAQSPLIFQEEA